MPLKPINNRMKIHHNFNAVIALFIQKQAQSVNNLRFSAINYGEYLHGVSTYPGQIALQVTPVPPLSKATT